VTRDSDFRPRKDRPGRSASAQRLGHAIGRAGREISGRVLDAVLPMRPSTSLDDVGDVRRLLLVRPNFRIGNTLLTNALVLGIHERFPDARLEILTGDTTTSLLAELPIDAVHLMSRSFVRKPWEFVALFWRLRRERFDVAIEAGFGSFSGGLYAFLTGARHRVGYEGRGARFLTVRLPRVGVDHAYDDAVVFARALGSSCPDRPVYRQTAVEEEDALRFLRETGLAASGEVAPFVAVFVGGHLHKRWPHDRWQALLRRLEAEGVPLVVFVGPEEATFAPELRAALPASVRIVPPQSLRRFAALLARARLLVTIDSGPMHLGVALGVPILALLQSEKSLFYRPRGEEDRSIARPSVDAAAAAVLAHPRVRSLLAPSRAVAQSSR